MTSAAKLLKRLCEADSEVVHVVSGYCHKFQDLKNKYPVDMGDPMTAYLFNVALMLAAKGETLIPSGIDDWYIDDQTYSHVSNSPVPKTENGLRVTKLVTKLANEAVRYIVQLSPFERKIVSKYLQQQYPGVGI